MSLITQCPACSTMFRVVPDQLRISEGWVRCGHCDEVFDANAHLQTLAESAPSLQPEPMPAAPTMLPASAGPAESHGDVPVSGLEDFDPLQPHAPFVDESLAGDGPSAPENQPIFDPFLVQNPHVESALEGAPEYPDAQETDSAWVQALETALVQSAAQPEPGELASAEQTPLSFMPQSNRLGTSRRWLGRKTVALLCLLLVGQFLVLERDRVAARVPALRPLLLAGCDLLSCSIAAPQQIEAIAIESSAFTSLKPGVYLLSVSLKNAAPVALAAPALELTLTDMQDQPLVRRVLLAKDFSGKPEIAAVSELSASVPISVQQKAENQKVTGYKLLAFYP